MSPRIPDDQAASGTPVRARRGIVVEWTDSVWLCLAISLVVGLLYALVIIGPAPLNPHNITWLTKDPAMYYTGWELFRQDPHWHWPLTFTDRVGYPLGENVALMDPNPLLVVLLKPLSPLLPEPFQYFGLEVVLICALQFFFSVKLFHSILGQNPVGIWLCSLFFLVSPPLAWNVTRHFAVSNHWLLVAALLVYFQAQQSAKTIRGFVISALVLAGVAVATNPYLAFQVVLVLTAGVASLLWQRRLSLPRALGFMSALGVICAIVAYSLGFFIAGGRGYGQWGYRFYSLNLLAPFDPYIYGSILSRLLHYFPRESPSYQGSSYLGAGVIFLALLVLIIFSLQPGKRRSLDRRKAVPLFLCCLALILMALSTKVMIGSTTLVDLDPQQHLTRFLAPLRISVFLFLVPYYTILMIVLAAPFLLFRGSRANLLLAAVLVVQLVDLVPLRNWSHAKANQTPPQPLKSPIWSTLGSFHENLVVLPAWQCGAKSTPGGEDGYRIFGLLAAAQRMRTNSYYSGRYTEADRDFHCKQSIAALAQGPLSPDTAYVVMPSLAGIIAKGPSGPGKCHDVDNFILCSSKTDFGLGAEQKSPE